MLQGLKKVDVQGPLWLCAAFLTLVEALLLVREVHDFI